MAVDAFVRRLAAVPAVLTALVVLTGCGGSSSSSSTASTAAAANTTGLVRCDPEPCQLSHAELAAKLDDLCIRGNAAVKQADASFEQSTKASEYTEAAAAMEAALSQFPPYEDTIQGLTPPAADGAALNRLVDVTRRIHGLSAQIVAAGRARDPAEVIRLSQLVQADLATRTGLAVNLGTKHCGL